jgi:ribosomal protein L16 Arg81 hydroxylase
MANQGRSTTFAESAGWTLRRSFGSSRHCSDELPLDSGSVENLRAAGTLSEGDMGSSTLAQILAPVPLNTFLREHFGRRPLLVRGKPGKFDALMKPKDFIYGLDRVTEIRCVFGELRQAAISPRDVREMYEAGATICVTGIDLAHASLRFAARRIEREIGYAGMVDFRGYFSPPGSGFDIHYDARVATTLQLDGTKTWWYSDKPHTPFPADNSPRSDMRAIRRAVAKVKLHKVTLGPGDLLCLPAGVWHKAKAGPSGALALNMAFNHKGATVLDVVLRHLQEKLFATASCREPFFTASTGISAERQQSNVRQCLDSLMRELAAVKTAALKRTRVRASGPTIHQR